MNTCSICHGELTTTTITYTQWFKGELIAVENVPASVCHHCGEEYFSPEIVDKLQKVVEFHHTSRTMRVPVFQFA